MLANGLCNLYRFFFVPSEAGHLDGEIVTIRIQCFEQWKVNRQLQDDELIDMFRA